MDDYLGLVSWKLQHFLLSIPAFLSPPTTSLYFLGVIVNNSVQQVVKYGSCGRYIIAWVANSLYIMVVIWSVCNRLCNHDHGTFNREKDHHRHTKRLKDNHKRDWSVLMVVHWYVLWHGLSFLFLCPTAVLCDSFISNMPTDNVTTPDELALLNGHCYFLPVVTPITAEWRTVTAAVWVEVTLAVCHAHSSKIPVFHTEIGGWRCKEKGLMGKVPIGVGDGADISIRTLRNMDRPTILCEQCITNLGHCFDSLVAGLHCACTGDAMATAGGWRLVDNLTGREDTSQAGEYTKHCLH